MASTCAASATETTAGRLAYLDRLKILFVGGVIFGHAWAGYSNFQGAWVYTDVREATLRPASAAVLEALLGPFALFAMGMFFLIAGLLTPGSVDRKGPARFARDRLVRLGLPLAVFTFLLWPPTAYLLDRLAGTPTGSLWSAFARPDPVQLWFAEVLLVYSLGYAALRAVRPVRPPRALPAATRLTLPRLFAVSAAVAATSFLMRGWFPLNTDGWLGLHLCQWAQYLALFILGLLAVRHGWLDPVPDRLRRACGIVAIAGTLAIAAFALIVAESGASPEEFLGGWNPAALATAAAEGLLSVHLAVWLLGTAQRRLTRPPRSPAATRDAFAAFLVQAHVLVVLALAVRPVPAPAEVKGLVVSLGGVALSFAVGHLLTGLGSRPAGAGAGVSASTDPPPV
ncbi:acyltransferase family protein [Dactylosporangium sp. NPDC048998]|uniref:acyltransferase family protein n=1 Tax=Dactylosporangium sp. NPDC048998 TaxID=3363976 RepID=UPI00372086B8